MGQEGAASPMVSEGICDDTMLKGDDGELLTAVMEFVAWRAGLWCLGWPGLASLISAAGPLVIKALSHDAVYWENLD